MCRWVVTATANPLCRRSLRPNASTGPGRCPHASRRPCLRVLLLLLLLWVLLRWVLLLWVLVLWVLRLLRRGCVALRGPWAGGVGRRGNLAAPGGWVAVYNLLLLPGVLWLYGIFWRPTWLAYGKYDDEDQDGDEGDAANRCADDDGEGDALLLVGGGRRRRGRRGRGRGGADGGDGGARRTDCEEGSGRQERGVRGLLYQPTLAGKYRGVARRTVKERQGGDGCLHTAPAKCTACTKHVAEGHRKGMCLDRAT